MTETKLRQLFDTGHGKKGEEKKNVLEISEEEEGGEDLKNEEAATGKAGGKAVLLKDKKLVPAKASKTKGKQQFIDTLHIRHFHACRRQQQQKKEAVRAVVH